VTERILDYPVTVCAACLQASCWLGIFMCADAIGARTVTKTVAELRDLKREHHTYWFKDPATGSLNTHAVAEYEALTR
jgi:hypothetical protein